MTNVNPALVQCLLSAGSFTFEMDVTMTNFVNKVRKIDPVHIGQDILEAAPAQSFVTINSSVFPARWTMVTLHNSNSVSGGQCHLIHFTILTIFFWPSLAHMCTKVA